jgi:outer membrane biosynthesis protein TonB
MSKQKKTTKKAAKKPKKASAKIPKKNKPKTAPPQINDSTKSLKLDPNPIRFKSIDLPEEDVKAFKSLEKSALNLVNRAKANNDTDSLYMPFCEVHGDLATNCMSRNAAVLMALAHTTDCDEQTDARPCAR